MSKAEAAEEKAPVLARIGKDDRSVYERVADVIAEMPGIGKDGFNQQQKFQFRSVEGIQAALKPLLGKHRIVIVPEVLERIAEQRETKGGGTLWTVHLHQRFTFFGPDGSSFSATAWGEGTDSGDKATNKAATGAFKNMVVRVFAVADDEPDPDASSPPASEPRSELPLVEKVRTVLYTLHGGDVDKIVADLKKRYGDRKDFDGKVASLSETDQEALLAELLAPAPEEVPEASEPVQDPL